MQLSTPRRRRLFFAALYMSEGAPIGFIWWALPTKLREAGLAVETITWLTALLVLPWTFKFLWAPLVDMAQGRYWSLRHWIISSQTVMGLALLPLAVLDMQSQLPWIVAALLVHAFAAATQDVAIDALCIARISPEERGTVNGWMQAGMLLGRSALGGGALMLGRVLGDVGVVVLLVAVVWSTLILVLVVRPEATTKEQSNSRMDNASDRFADFRHSLAIAVTQRNTWVGLLFALTAAAAFEGAGIVAGPMLVDEGLPSEMIGYLFAVPVVFATLSGSLIGGRLADRVPRRRAVALAAFVMIAAVLGLSLVQGFEAAFADAGGHLQACLLLLAAMYLGVGMFTATSYALLMDLTSPGIAATQFSAFMGATNGCESWSGFAAGRLARLGGYAAVFAGLSCVSLVSLVLLRWLRPTTRRADDRDVPYAQHAAHLE